MSLSSIEWTDATWNPVRGCSMAKGSELGGCLNCYAARMASRNLPEMRSPSTGKPFARITANGPRWTGAVELIPDKLSEPLHWKKPRRVFVNSMSDLFHESLSELAIARVFNVMADCPQHTFQILTKRPERMHAILTGPKRHEHWSPRVWHRTTLANVWLGVSVEDQKTADARIPLLLQTPAAVRWVSYEPALGPVDFENYLYSVRKGLACAAYSGSSDRAERLDWIVVGGESGPGARPFNVAWARRTARQCKRAGVRVFVKQLGANVRDRNDAGFEAENETWADGPDAGRPTCPQAWPTPHGGVEDIDTGYQGAEVRVHLKNHKGGDMSEWPDDLRVRQFPGDAA